MSASKARDAFKKSKLLGDIKKALKEVKAIREGKARSYSMSDLFAKK